MTSFILWKLDTYCFQKGATYMDAVVEPHYRELPIHATPNSMYIMWLKFFSYVSNISAMDQN